MINVFNNVWFIWYFCQAGDFDSGETTETAAPRLVVIVHDNTPKEGYLIGFEQIISCTGKDVCSHLVDLIAAYYAWDVSYPKQYQLLGLLQTELLMDEKSSFTPSTSLTKFRKLLMDTVISDH